MVTIKEIAKKANVSEGTVDRVIHNRGGVSKKTEEKIKKILAQNNFKINPIARALAMKKKYIITILFPEYDNQNFFWQSPHLGALKAHSEVSNYGVELNFVSFDEFDPNSYAKAFNQLIDEKPDAVILIPVFQEETKNGTSKLEDLGIPYMFLNITLQGFNNISFIGQDSFKAGYVVGKLMNISLNTGDACLTVQTRSNITDNNTIYQRIQGFNDYLNSNNLNIKTFNLKFDDLDDLEMVSQQLNTVIADNSAIKGIYVLSSRASIIADCLKEEFLKRQTIIGFDTTPLNVRCMKEDKIDFLISQKSFNQGYEAVRVMTDYLIQNKKPRKNIYSPIQIIIKENLDFSNRNKDAFQSEYFSEGENVISQH